MTAREWADERAGALTDSGSIIPESGLATPDVGYARLIRDGVSKDVRLSGTRFASWQARLEEILRQIAGLLPPQVETFYHLDGTILLLTLGPSTFEERKAVYECVRRDVSVPDAAPLLLDVRRFPGLYSEALLRERLPMFWEALGAKAGPVCAVVLSDGQGLDGYVFQLAMADRELCVAMFHALDDAHRWLRAFLRGTCV